MGTPQERIVKGILNPHSKKPISVETLVRAFADELEMGMTEMESIVGLSLAQQIKKGNMTAIIWWTKNRAGWRDDPDAAQRAREAKTDPARADVKHEVEIIGGLPAGSRPDKPEGDGYSEIPPEETHG
jgi:hypothetical protein